MSSSLQAEPNSKTTPSRRSQIFKHKLKDVFIQPVDQSFALYAPLAGITVGIVPELATFIDDLKNGRDPLQIPDQNAWLEFLADLDTFSSECPQLEVEEPASRSFQPTHVTLSLTTNCNLRCVYCYIRGGERNSSMPQPVAEAAINFVAANAQAKGSPSFGVTFHGEGEPTFNWPLFKAVVSYAEQVAHDRGLSVSFMMTSNGLWSRSQAEFISNRFSDISISLDGLSNVQTAQRPTASGKSSFDTVIRTLATLAYHEVPCGIRATVMPSSVGELIPFLDYISTNTQVKYIRFEPIFDAGRAKELSSSQKEGDNFERAFTKAFLAARAFGRKRDLIVTYSGCGDINKSGKFCGATGDDLNFTVMTDGTVSSCYEVSSENDELGEFFVYGRYESERQGFHFLDGRMERLLTFSSKKNSPCGSCFAQWTCQGDCLARYNKQALLSGGTSSRCSLNKSILSANLRESAGSDRTDCEANPERSLL